MNKTNKEKLQKAINFEKGRVIRDVKDWNEDRQYGYIKGLEACLNNF